VARADAEYFDNWYSNIIGSPACDRIVGEALGLPPELRATGNLPWAAIDDIVEALAVGVGAVLVDLGCGRGGYGIEVARRTGTRLVGVDFSAVALAQAMSHADAAGLAGRTEFRLGDLQASGLEDASVDAVMCIDTIQFADSVVAALVDCRRILRPGGRLVLTWWEARTRGDPSFPERLRDLDVEAALQHAGFDNVDVVERPDWHEAERAMWMAAVDTEPDEHDDALQDLQGEAQRVLPVFDATRRLVGRATALPHTPTGTRSTT
jgi:SAM-dependent methyltransferase